MSEGRGGGRQRPNKKRKAGLGREMEGLVVAEGGVEREAPQPQRRPLPLERRISRLRESGEAVEARVLSVGTSLVQLLLWGQPAVRERRLEGVGGGEKARLALVDLLLEQEGEARLRVKLLSRRDGVLQVAASGRPVGGGSTVNGDGPDGSDDGDDDGGRSLTPEELLLRRRRSRVRKAQQEADERLEEEVSQETLRQYWLRREEEAPGAGPQGPSGYRGFSD